MVSNRRIALQNGRTFPQLSLSEFYRGLCLLSTPNAEAYENGVFPPIRRSNPECLVGPDGRSVVSRIAELCDYIIIEDADVKPEDLSNTRQCLAYVRLSSRTLEEPLG